MTTFATFAVTAIVAVIIIIAVINMPPPDFVSAAEFGQIARRAPYFAAMSGADLTARGATSAAEYQEFYTGSAREWTIRERLHMWRVTRDAEGGLLRELEHRMGYRPKLRWRFAKIAQGVEMNYPHTHEDVIVWNEANLNETYRDQVNLAAHEMVHVLQRRDPEIWHNYYKKLGYVPSSAEAPLRRNNPDTTDIWVVDGRLSIAQYRSARPRDLSDVDGGDHPAECVAYEIGAAVI